VAQDGTFRELGLRVCLPAIMRRSLAFEAWKALLRNDCVGSERLQASDALGEATLRILYENGTDPTLEGVVPGGLSGKPRRCADYPLSVLQGRQCVSPDDRACRGLVSVRHLRT
jgi:hypothetical protein